jgi:hypothetical protein
MLKLNIDKFELEAHQLTRMYADLNRRGGARNPYNSEILADIIEVLNHWERVSLLFDIDPMEATEKNLKMMQSIRIQVKALKVLEQIYEEQYEI